MPINAPADLRLQVWIYILCVCGLFSGLLALAGQTWEALSVPYNLLVSVPGAMALILSSVIITSLLLRVRLVHTATGALLLAVAAYRGIDLTFGSDPWLPGGQSWRSYLSVAGMLMLGSVAVLGMEKRPQRLWARAVGACGMLMGAYGLFLHLSPSPINSVAPSPVFSLYGLGFGLAMITLPRSHHRPALYMGANAAGLGALSVLGTFLLLLLASWGVPLERQQSARSIVHHHAAMLDDELESATRLMSRLADRWSALELDIPEPLQSTEIERYFADIPALLSLLTRYSDGRVLLHESRTATEQQWLSAQLNNPAVISWANDARTNNFNHAWMLPDAHRPLTAILLLMPEPASGTAFFASFSAQTFLIPTLHLEGHEFGIAIEAAEHAPHSMPETTPSDIRERVTVQLPNGPTLNLVATGGPIAPLSLRGALAPSIVASGLLVSYLLTLARSLASIHRRSSRELKIKDQRFRSLFSQNPDAVYEFSRDGYYVSMNTKAKALTGLSDTHLGVVSYTALLNPAVMSRDDYRIFDEAFARTVAGAPTTFVIRFLTVARKWGHYECSFVPIVVDQSVVGVYAVVKDITEQRAQQKQLAYQATHDVLTGLANRSLFEDRLERDIALARQSGEQLAVLFVDLDEFKPINDTLGHRVGDQVLISVAERLRQIIRPADTLARFGGDEYVLLLPHLKSGQEAEQMAERILQLIGPPHSVNQHELYVTASIGISLLPPVLDSPAKMLQQADMAMYKAKQQGRDAFVLYTEDLDTKLSRRVTLRNELQEAITSDQLRLHYQPQIDDRGRLYGLEALVRWQHPEKGIIPPSAFIPVAEETGQIVHLGRWVITQACKDARKLLDMGALRGRIAVNLSPLEFHRTGFLPGLRDVLQQTGLPSSCLELELTESILMRNSEGAIDILNALNAMDITSSLDDFGTGYSSFSYLRDLPVENVKIDKSFVDRVLSSQRDAAVCKGVITMAREMDIKVIAEGVETREQFELLASFGCEVFQGFYFAKPMSFADLLKWVERGHTFHRDASLSLQ